MVNETDYNEAVKILKAHNPNIDFVIQNEWSVIKILKQPN